MKKNIFITFIIIATIALTYTFVSYIIMTTFAFAWGLNFLLMMCVSIFLEVLKSDFTFEYYQEKTWEHKGIIYEKLGINIYRKLLVLIGWEKLNKKANPVKNNLDALIHLEYKTKQAESGHLIIFLIVLGFTVYAAIQYSLAKCLWLIFLNILLNLYPILLQRYNRPRLQRLIKVMKYKNGEK